MDSTSTVEQDATDAVRDNGAEVETVKVESSSHSDSFPKRLFKNQSLRSALFAFTLTRVLILVIFILVGVWTTVPDAFPGHHYATVNLHRKSVPRILRNIVLTADVNWYLGIAEQGYAKGPFDGQKPQNWAFFPLFPLTVRLLSNVTGEFVLTGMFVSHLCFLIALFLLHRVTLLYGYDVADANRAVLYLAIFPTSYFFSVPISESMFLMFTLATFYFARQQKWLWAALMGILASASRTPGVVLLPALVIVYWDTYRPIKSLKTLPKSGLALLLIPAGAMIYMVYLYFLTGNFFAFMGAQAAWGRKPGGFWIVLFKYLQNFAEIGQGWDFNLMNFAAILLAIISGAMLLKQRKISLGAFTLLGVLFATSSALLQSQARYMMVLFPMFIFLGSLGRNYYIDQIVKTVSVALLALMSALFAAHVTLVLS